MKLSKKTIIIIAAVLVFLIGGGVTFAINTPAALAERQLNLGNKYLQEGKYQEAILAFQKVIEIEPKNIPARLGLGEAYVETNEFDKAEAVLKEVIDIDPNNIPAREALFLVYVKEGNLEAANDILKEITSLDPQKDMGQYSTDLDLAKAIITSKTSYELGIKQMNNKQYLEAIDSFRKVIKEDSNRYDDAQVKISECKKAFIDETLQKAKDAAANKDYQTALDLIEQVLKVDSNNQEALKLKGDYTSSLEEEKKISNSYAQSVKRFIEEGIIPDSQFQFGTPIQTIINKRGKPKYIGTDYGNYYQYDDVTYFVDNESKLIGVHIGEGENLGIKIGKTLIKDVPGIIGIPAKLQESTEEGDTWFVSYHSKCSVIFFASSPEGSVDGIRFINHI